MSQLTLFNVELYDKNLKEFKRLTKTPPNEGT